MQNNATESYKHVDKGHRTAPVSTTTT